MIGFWDIEAQILSRLFALFVLIQFKFQLNSNTDIRHDTEKLNNIQFSIEEFVSIISCITQLKGLESLASVIGSGRVKTLSWLRSRLQSMLELDFLYSMEFSNLSQS